VGKANTGGKRIGQKRITDGLKRSRNQRAGNCRRSSGEEKGN
jgi:hypothetical protein